MGGNALYALLAYLLGVNVVAFGAYGVDKQKAKRHQWRIPEHTLLALAFAGGALGAALGMRVFHHKTQKSKFRFGVPVALVLWLIFLAFLGVRLTSWLL